MNHLNFMVGYEIYVGTRVTKKPKVLSLTMPTDSDYGIGSKYYCKGRYPNWQDFTEISRKMFEYIIHIHHGSGVYLQW